MSSSPLDVFVFLCGHTKIFYEVITRAGLVFLTPALKLNEEVRRISEVKFFAVF